MGRRLHLSKILAVFLALAACRALAASPSAEAPPQSPYAGKKIAVFPFKGPDLYAFTASEWFAHVLATENRLEVWSPGRLEVLLRDKGEAIPKVFTEKQPLELARSLGADYALEGEVGTQWKDFSAMKSCAVKLTDVAGSQPVLEASGFESVVFARNVHQDTMDACEKAVDALLCQMFPELAPPPAPKPVSTLKSGQLFEDPPPAPSPPKGVRRP